MIFNILWLIAVSVLVSIVIADIVVALKGRVFSRFPFLFSVLRLILTIALMMIGAILAICKIIVEGDSFFKEAILNLSMMIALIYMAFGALMMEYMDRENQCPH